MRKKGRGRERREGGRGRKENEERRRSRCDHDRRGQKGGADAEVYLVGLLSGRLLIDYIITLLLFARTGAKHP